MAEDEEEESDAEESDYCEDLIAIYTILGDD
jgi:hypothetical protein